MTSVAGDAPRCAGAAEAAACGITGEIGASVSPRTHKSKNRRSTVSRSLPTMVPTLRQPRRPSVFFDAMAREYARRHPAASGDLNEYGERLAEFVAAFPHTQDLPYLPDVACMEWLAHRAYYAADSTAFDPARLAGVPPSRHVDLRPALAPACALLESDWPFARIWTVHQDDFEGNIEVDLDAGRDRVLIHRPVWRVQVLALGRGTIACSSRRSRAPRSGARSRPR